MTDIYATVMYYNLQAKATQDFFKTVQKKLHFAINGSKAAELIMTRTDSAKENMVLTTWRNVP
ncbi:MAG: RhuM family protein [Carboxydocellales bacterium]